MRKSEKKSNFFENKRCPKKNDHFFNVVFHIVEKVFNAIVKTAKTKTSPNFFTCFVKNLKNVSSMREMTFSQKQNRINQKSLDFFKTSLGNFWTYFKIM